MSPQFLPLVLEAKQPPNLPGVPHPCAVHHLGAQDPSAAFGARYGAAPRPPLGTKHHHWGRSGRSSLPGGIVSWCANEAVSMETGPVSAQAPCSLFIYFIRWRASEPRAAFQQIGRRGRRRQENPRWRRGINPGWDGGLWPQVLVRGVRGAQGLRAGSLSPCQRKRGATSTLGMPGLLSQPRLLLSSARLPRLPPPGNMLFAIFFPSVVSFFFFWLYLYI